MTTILIPENADDLRIVEDMADQQSACTADPDWKNTSLEAVALVPNTDDGDDGWAKWTVVDNRDRQAFVENFATLDGAMVYASDIRTSIEGQKEWDVDGMFLRLLSDLVKPVKRDALEHWNGRDHDDLVDIFVESILDNVNGLHSVRYFTKRNRTPNGKSETDYLVEITYVNGCGAMCTIDDALEQMNGRDFRMVCDKFLKLTLDRAGFKSSMFRWPTPDARVSRDWYEDDDDVTKTVTITWKTDPVSWRTIVKNTKNTNEYES